MKAVLLFLRIKLATEERTTVMLKATVITALCVAICSYVALAPSHGSFKELALAEQESISGGCEVLDPNRMGCDFEEVLCSFTYCDSETDRGACGEAFEFIFDGPVVTKNKTVLNGEGETKTEDTTIDCGYYAYCDSGSNCELHIDGWVCARYEEPVPLAHETDTQDETVPNSVCNEQIARLDRRGPFKRRLIVSAEADSINGIRYSPF